MNEEAFIGRIDCGYITYRPLLWLALRETEGEVVELGSGYGSTPLLRQFCAETQRPFRTYDWDAQWAEKTGATPVTDWDTVPLGSPGLLFVDHSPGERRKLDIVRWQDTAQVIVAHDTEPVADHGYQMRVPLRAFRYFIDFEYAGAWTSAASNFKDVTVWSDELARLRQQYA